MDQLISFIGNNYEKIGIIVTSIITIAGFPFLIWKTHLLSKNSKAALKQAEAALSQANGAKVNNFIENFNKAIEYLRSEELSVRVGGINTLQCLLEENKNKKNEILDILRLFCRGAISKTEKIDTKKQSEDILKCISVLAQNNYTLDEKLVKLGNLDLSCINLEDALLENAYFENSNLESSNLKNTNLSWSIFDHANLEKINLSKSYGLGMSFKSANLHMCDIVDATLRGVNFSNAKLPFANLKNSDLTGANFEKADLTHTNLRNTNLNLVNLKGAELEGADMRGSDLRRAINYTKEQLNKAITDKKTKFPS